MLICSHFFKTYKHYFLKNTKRTTRTTTVFLGLNPYKVTRPYYLVSDSNRGILVLDQIGVCSLRLSPFVIMCRRGFLSPNFVQIKRIVIAFPPWTVSTPGYAVPWTRAYLCLGCYCSGDHLHTTSNSCLEL